MSMVVCGEMSPPCGSATHFDVCTCLRYYLGSVVNSESFVLGGCFCFIHCRVEVPRCHRVPLPPEATRLEKMDYDAVAVKLLGKTYDTMV